MKLATAAPNTKQTIPIPSLLKTKITEKKGKEGEIKMCGENLEKTALNIGSKEIDLSILLGKNTEVPDECIQKKESVDPNNVQALQKKT